MADLIRGQTPPSPVPPEASEVVIAWEFKWPLEYVRSLTNRDYEVITEALKMIWALRQQDQLRI